jgi:hypothetical protein
MLEELQQTPVTDFLVFSLPHLKKKKKSPTEHGQGSNSLQGTELYTDMLKIYYKVTL